MDGYLKEEVENRRQELEEQVKLADLLREFIKGKGWKVVEEEMMMRLHRAGTQLRKANDMRMIGFYQGQMDVLDGLLRFPQTEIKAGEDANIELEGRNE